MAPLIGEEQRTEVVALRQKILAKRAEGETVKRAVYKSARHELYKKQDLGLSYFGTWSAADDGRIDAMLDYLYREPVSTRILGQRTAPFHLFLFLTASRMVLPQDPSTDPTSAPWTRA